MAPALLGCLTLLILSYASPDEAEPPRAPLPAAQRRLGMDASPAAPSRTADRLRLWTVWGPLALEPVSATTTTAMNLTLPPPPYPHSPTTPRQLRTVAATSWSNRPWAAPTRKDRQSLARPLGGLYLRRGPRTEEWNSSVTPIPMTPPSPALWPTSLSPHPPPLSSPPESRFLLSLSVPSPLQLPMPSASLPRGRVFAGTTIPMTPPPPPPVLTLRPPYSPQLSPPLLSLLTSPPPSPSPQGTSTPPRIRQRAVTRTIAALANQQARQQVDAPTDERHSITLLRPRPRTYFYDEGPRTPPLPPTAHTERWRLVGYWEDVPLPPPWIPP